MNRLPDPQQAIVDHLGRGGRLIGPVRVGHGSPGGSRPAPWGFADGRRAGKISVEALIRRGILAASEADGQRAAVLAGAS